MTELQQAVEAVDARARAIETGHAYCPIAQAWAHGLACGMQLLEARRRAARAASTSGPLPECGQVWECGVPSRLHGRQRRRVRIATVGFEAAEDYVVGSVVRGEGALRGQRVRLTLAELHRNWTLVAGLGADRG